MNDTSASLLDRLRLQPDGEAWRRLVELYDPLIRNWLRQHALLEQDYDDVVQDVLAVVVRRLAEFDRERPGSFRRWLRSITVNCLRNHQRANRYVAGTIDHHLQQLEDPHSELSRLWDQQHDRHVTQRLLALLRPRFSATTWTAFQRLVLEEVTVDQVAEELSLSVNAVFIAKSRVLSQLRQEGRGLLD